MDGFEDLAHVAARVTRVSEDRPDIAATFTVHRKDDGAVFICGDAETLGFRSQNPTASLTMRVQCKYIFIPIVPQANSLQTLMLLHIKFTSKIKGSVCV